MVEPIKSLPAAPGFGATHFLFTIEHRLAPFLHQCGREAQFERGNEAEGFLIVAAAADKGLVNIHHQAYLFWLTEAVWKWMRQDVLGIETEEIATDGAVSTDHFIWHLVAQAVENVKN